MEQGEDLEITFRINSRIPMASAGFRCVVTSLSGEAIGLVPSEEFSIGAGVTEITMVLRTGELAPGSYLFDPVLYDRRKEDYVKITHIIQAIGFRVSSAVIYYNTVWQKKYWGNVLFEKMIRVKDQEEDPGE